MQTPIPRQLSFRQWKIGMRSVALALLATLMVVLGAGCASQQVAKPVEQLTEARTAVDNAIDAKAREFAPVELEQSQEHLNNARQANEEEEYLKAQRLAEKAAADAHYARAKSEHAQSRQTLAEVEEGIETLKQETQTN